MFHWDLCQTAGTDMSDYRDGKRARQSFRGILDIQNDCPRTVRSLYHNNQLTAEKSHFRLSERLKRRGIPVTSRPEVPCSCHLEREIVVSRRYLIAVFVNKTHCDKAQIVTVCTQPGAVSRQLQGSCLTCCKHGFLIRLVAVSVISDDLQLSGSVYHIRR